MALAGMACAPDFELRNKSSINGIVVDERGIRVPEVTIEALNDHGVLLGAYKSNVEGKYVIPGQNPAERFLFSREGFWSEYIPLEPSRRKVNSIRLTRLLFTYEIEQFKILDQDALNQQVQSLLAANTGSHHSLFSLLLDAGEAQVQALFYAAQTPETAFNASFLLSNLANPSFQNELLKLPEQQISPRNRDIIKALVASALIQPSAEQAWSFLELGLQESHRVRSACLESLCVNGTERARKMLAKATVQWPDNYSPMLEQAFRAFGTPAQARASNLSDAIQQVCRAVPSVENPSAFALGRMLKNQSDSQCFVEVSFYRDPHLPRYLLTFYKKDGVWVPHGLFRLAEA